MKKFISIMMTAAILLSLCVSVANAATYANPIIHVYSELYDNGDDVEPDSPHTYYNRPTGYDVYKISYTTEGVDLSEETLTVLTIKFSISDASKIHSKSWLKYVVSGKGTKDLNGVLYPYGQEPNSINAGAYSWTNEGGVGTDLYDWLTNPAGGTEEIDPIIDTLIYVQQGETVTFTYQTELVPAAEVGNWDTTSQMEIKTDATGAKRSITTALRYTVNGANTNILTLGSSGSSNFVAQSSGDVSSKNLTDLNGNAVTELSKNYGITKITTESLDPLTKRYYLLVTDTNDVTNEADIEDFEIDFGAGGDHGVYETSGDVSFYALVHSTTHVIKSIALQVVDRP